MRLAITIPWRYSRNSLVCWQREPRVDVVVDYVGTICLWSRRLCGHDVAIEYLRGNENFCETVLICSWEEKRGREYHDTGPLRTICYKRTSQQNFPNTLFCYRLRQAEKVVGAEGANRWDECRQELG